MKTLFLTILLIAITPAFSQISNTKAGTWSDISVWSNNQIPNRNTDVFLNYDIIIDIDAYCKSLTSNGHTVTVNSNATLNIGKYSHCDSLVNDSLPPGDLSYISTSGVISPNYDGINDILAIQSNNLSLLTYTIFDTANAVIHTDSINYINPNPNTKPQFWAPPTPASPYSKYFIRLQGTTLQNKRIGKCSTLYSFICIPTNINRWALSWGNANPNDPVPYCYNCDGLINDSLPDSDKGRIYIPNTVTPNNDGINDYFQVPYFDIDSIEITIYDRANSIIFHTTNLNEKWFPDTLTANRFSQYFYKVQAITKAGNRIGKCGELYLLSCVPIISHIGKLRFLDQVTPLGFTNTTQEVLLLNTRCTY